MHSKIHDIMKKIRKVKKAVIIPPVLGLLFSGGLNKNPAVQKALKNELFEDNIKQDNFSDIEKIASGFSPPSKKMEKRHKTSTKTSSIMDSPKANVDKTWYDKLVSTFGLGSKNNQKRPSYQSSGLKVNFSKFPEKFDKQDLEIAAFLGRVAAYHQLLGRPTIGDKNYNQFYKEIVELSKKFVETHKDENKWIFLDDVTYRDLKQAGLTSGKNYRPGKFDVFETIRQGDIFESEGRYFVLADKDGTCILVMNVGKNPQIRWYVAEDDITPQVEKIQSLLKEKGSWDPSTEIDVEPSYVIGFIEATTMIKTLYDDSTTLSDSELLKEALHYLRTNEQIEHKMIGKYTECFSVPAWPGSDETIRFYMKRNPRTGKMTAYWVNWRGIKWN